MKITREDALVILEMIGSSGDFQGNTASEELLDTRIRQEFSDDEEVSEYDYSEQKKKYGW